MNIIEESNYTSGCYIKRVQINNKRRYIVEIPESDNIVADDGKILDNTKLEIDIEHSANKFVYPNYGKIAQEKAERESYLENYCRLRDWDLAIATLNIVYGEKLVNIAKILQQPYEWVKKRAQRMNLNGIRNALYNDTFGILKGDISYKST